MDVSVAERTTILDLLIKVGVPWEEVGLVVVNGKLADEKRELVAGDRIEVFSPIGGG